MRRNFCYEFASWYVRQLELVVAIIGVVQSLINLRVFPNIKSISDHT